MEVVETTMLGWFLHLRTPSERGSTLEFFITPVVKCVNTRNLLSPSHLRQALGPGEAGSAERALYAERAL